MRRSRTTPSWTRFLVRRLPPSSALPMGLRLVATRRMAMSSNLATDRPPGDPSGVDTPVTVSSKSRTKRPQVSARLRPDSGTLWEHFVHHQDIRRPLGLRRPFPPASRGVGMTKSAQRAEARGVRHSLVMGYRIQNPWHR
jgi:hypothetical protein